VETNRQISMGRPFVSSVLLWCNDWSGGKNPWIIQSFRVDRNVAFAVGFLVYWRTVEMCFSIMTLYG
jgi:hypothetical protein